jgi:hypothetical protein
MDVPVLPPIVVVGRFRSRGRFDLEMFRKLEAHTHRVSLFTGLKQHVISKVSSFGALSIISKSYVNPTLYVPPTLPSRE